MKKVMFVFVIIFMISGLHAAPILDGIIDAGEGWIVGAANSDSTDLDGADLDTFYYYISQDSLYFAVKTQNRASWDVAYGFSIDVDQTDSSGYIGDPGAGIWDSWGRHIVFANEPPDYFAPDYQVYFWYNGASGITSVNFNRYNGVGWDYSIAPVEYAYTWDTLLGLHVLELKVALESLGNPHHLHIVSYIAGGDNSSCVDVLPYDPSVVLLSDGAEWTDIDTLHNFIDIFITGGEGWIIGATNSDTTDLAGADLNAFYYYVASDTLYLAVTTQNEASWSVAYGFSIDVDQTDGSGYIGDPGAGIWDSWGRHIVFANEAPDYFAPDYQIYFWYDQALGITLEGFNRYNGTGWDYDIAPVEYTYTGDTLLGLHVLELKVALESLGNPHRLHIVSYITGGDNSSCVDVLPYDSTVDLLSGGAEWTDTDTLHYFVDILITGIENRSHRPRILTPVLNGIKIEGNGIYTLELYSLDGRKVHEETVKVNGSKVVKFNLPSGMYLVLDREAGVSKFIVIK